MSIHNKSEKYSANLKGEFLPDTPTGEYGFVSSGESHPDVKTTEFCGPTKGNKDLPINRTEGVSTGHGGGQHKAGGVKKKYIGMDYSSGNY